MQAETGMWRWQNLKGEEGASRIANVMSTDSVDIAKILATKGMGIVQLPLSQARGLVAEGKLVELFDYKFLNQTNYHLVYRTREYMPLRLKVLIESLQTFYGIYGLSPDDEGEVSSESLLPSV